MIKIHFAFFIILSLSSCYSYKIFPTEYQKFEYAGEKKKAFILNPELKKESAIFGYAGIFDITSDSTDEQAVKIRLLPMKRNLSCGQPIIASAITLGQIPVFFPDRYQYEFEEINGTGRVERSYELDVAQRVWFWDMFVFHKNFKQKAGKALTGNYYKPSTPSQINGTKETMP